MLPNSESHPETPRITLPEKVWKMDLTELWEIADQLGVHVADLFEFLMEVSK